MGFYFRINPNVGQDDQYRAVRVKPAVEPNYMV
jgi:hypothetical protein